MHLKWSPDWETAVSKATNEGYHLLPITPPLNEFMFCTNRSSHGVDDQLFFEMAAQWGGYKFSPFLYRLVAPEALKKMQPLKKDRFVKLKLLKWGRGWLYILDRYLGYVDKEMVYAVLHAGQEMRNADLEEFFMCKDGNIHITLIDPGRFQDGELMKLADTIVKTFPEPPQTVYTGVGTLEDMDKKTQTYFLTTNNESQQEWENIIAKASSSAFGQPTEPQPDGIHVTIGFKGGDIWRQNKRIDPFLPFQNPQNVTQPYLFLPHFRGELLSANTPAGSREGTPASEPLPTASDPGRIFGKEFRRRLQGRPLNLSAVPKHQLAILDYLIDHRYVVNKFRECPNGYYLFGFTVRAANRWSSDDDTYKKNPRLQALVPRGLTHAFKVANDGTVDWLGAVYPTSKFFGDNDTEEGVDLVGDEELQAETHGGKGVKFILTEKANGEMFTFSVLDKVRTEMGDTKYVVVCGSKNNKFLFELVLDGARKTTSKEIQEMLVNYLPGKSERQTFSEEYKHNRGWTYSRVWLEMSDVFLNDLLRNPNATWFCEMLYESKQTACAEFESYLHPHVLAFPQGHQKHRIFALTSYREDGTPSQTEDPVRFRQLLELREKGFGTVEISDASSTDVMELRRDVWNRTNSEGVVLLVVFNGQIEKMIKMKTIWYVVHRGFRENLRRHATNKSASPLTVAAIRPGLQKKLRDKLAIFGMKKDESGYWDAYLEALAEYVVKAKRDLGQEKFADLFLYDYPKIIAGAEETMATDGDKRSWEAREENTPMEGVVVHGKRSGTPPNAAERSPKRGR